MSDIEKGHAVDASNAQRLENSTTTYGIPLLIRPGKSDKTNTYEAYICLMNSNYSFASSSIQNSKYGWVPITGDEANRLSKPPLQDYWKYLVVISKTGSSQETTLTSPLGVLREHPYFSGAVPPAEGENKVELFDAPFLKKASRADIVNYYVDRHDKWRLLAPLNVRNSLSRSYPRAGWEKESYLKGKQEADGTYFLQDASDSWKELKNNLKGAVNVGAAYEDVRKGFIKDNLITQEDEAVLQKDKGGQIVQRSGKNFVTARWTGAEYSRLAPERFKMAGKRFNKLLSTTPSTVLKPVNQWVKAISDVEVFALAGLAAVIQVISFGKAFK